MQLVVALLAFGAKAQWRLAYTGAGPGPSLGSGSGPLAASRSAVAPENPAVARGGSRCFLDTADVAEWEALLPLGMFHGVTTNPTLLERAGVACTVDACRQLAGTAAALGVEEIMFQAWISPISPIHIPDISPKSPPNLPDISQRSSSRRGARARRRWWTPGCALRASSPRGSRSRSPSQRPA